MSRDVKSLSKQLSWLLRHGAGEVNLAMDEAGWSAIGEVLEVLSMTRDDLNRAVEYNDKARLEVKGDRIRACQGHSLEGMPVTMEGLEASWDIVAPTRTLWHGTKVTTIDGIAESGISPVHRTHVHLAAAVDSRVGKRAAVDLLLEVDPVILRSVGIKVFRSPNGVLLVRRVSRNALIGVRAVSKLGELSLPAARTRLNLQDTGG